MDGMRVVSVGICLVVGHTPFGGRGQGIAKVYTTYLFKKTITHWHNIDIAIHTHIHTQNSFVIASDKLFYALIANIISKLTKL